jgi:hypothetical protein
MPMASATADARMLDYVNRVAQTSIAAVRALGLAAVGALMILSEKQASLGLDGGC